MRSRDFEDGYDKAIAEAAGSVQVMDRKLTDATRMLWAVVAACGGEVRVPYREFYRLQNPKWVIEHNDAEACVVLKLRE